MIRHLDIIYWTYLKPPSLELACLNWRRHQADTLFIWQLDPQILVEIVSVFSSQEAKQDLFFIISSVRFLFMCHLGMKKEVEVERRLLLLPFTIDWRSECSAAL